MIKKMGKRGVWGLARKCAAAAVAGIMALSLAPAIPARAADDVGADLTIQAENVRATYRGRAQAAGLISGLRFSDLPADEATRDAVVRAGALEIIRPDAPQFRPGEPVTVQDALIFSLRAVGLSQQAMAQAGPAPPLGDAWAAGYMQLATQLGIAAAADVANADITTARREDVAGFLVGALESQQPGLFAATGAGIALQRFSDWNDVAPGRAAAVESLLQHNVMGGETAATFGPDSAVTRGEMARIIRNLDGLHYGMMGLERVRGIVGQTSSEVRAEIGAGATWHRVYVRRADGLVDVLEFSDSAPEPQPGPIDAVVLRGGSVTGLAGLQVNDQIEYIVEPATGTVLYVQVSAAGTPAAPSSYTGRLEFINFPTNEITFRDQAGGLRTFALSASLVELRAGEHFIRFDGAEFLRAQELPRGAYYEVTLLGNLVTGIRFVGQPVAVPEIRGIVIDNNYWLGSMTILDENRAERSFTYIPGAVRVQRRVFYDMRDIVGGVHEMFPRPMPRETTMESVIPGDIVVFWVDGDDPFRITSLSAAENTASRWGRVREIVNRGGHFDMMLEMENGRTAWYAVVSTAHVTEGGRPVSADRVQLGDWVRLVVNQAVVAPGVALESVREIAIDVGGHHISSIIMGNLSGFNQVQQEISLQHAQVLTPAGWRLHSPVRAFNINNPNIRFYHDGNRVSLAHINRYLQRSDAVVYMAVESHFSGDRVTVLSVRSGRDILLEPDFVMAAQDSQFMMPGIPGFIRTDPGTIVVRNGRLVEEHHIFPDDWTTVSINGNNTAAVVDIGVPPVTGGAQIVVGTVNRVFPFNSFMVRPTFFFEGFGWEPNFADVTFAIDHDTIFIDESGTVTDIHNFIGYGDDSVIQRNFMAVVDGGRAERVIHMTATDPANPAPGNFFNPIPAHNYTGTLVARGIVTQTPAGGVIPLRDVSFYTHGAVAAPNVPVITGWNPIGIVNATGEVQTGGNTIIIDRNRAVPAGSLRMGQQIMVFSPVMWSSPPQIGPGMPALPATIILVEN